MNPVYIYDIVGMERPGVSFLSPSQVKDLGGLPNEAIIAVSRLPKEVIIEVSPIDKYWPDSWVVMESFLRLMHGVIQKEGPSNPGLLTDARGKRNGDLYIVDLCNADGGYVGPIYIVGGFRVRKGKIIGESYRPNPIYQVYTGHGWPHLSRYLHEPLIKAMCEAEPQAAASLVVTIADSAQPPSEGKSLLKWCDYCGGRAIQLDACCPRCRNLSAGARYIDGVEAKTMFDGVSFLDRRWHLYTKIREKTLWLDRPLSTSPIKSLLIYLMVVAGLVGLLVVWIRFFL